MKALLCTTAALVLALSAVPAGADDVAPQGTDACGDGGTAVTVSGQRAEAEAAAVGADLRSAALRVVRPREGAPVLLGDLGTCGPASPDVLYTLSWGYADGCSLALQRIQTLVPQGVQEQLVETCTPRGSLVTQLSGQRSTTYALPPSVFGVEGDTALFRVPLDLVPAALAPRLAPGARWASTYATASTAQPSVGEAQAFVSAVRVTGTVRRDALTGTGGTVEQPEG